MYQMIEGDYFLELETLKLISPKYFVVAHANLSGELKKNILSGKTALPQSDFVRD